MNFKNLPFNVGDIYIYKFPIALLPHPPPFLILYPKLAGFPKPGIEADQYSLSISYRQCHAEKTKCRQQNQDSE